MSRSLQIRTQCCCLVWIQFSVVYECYIVFVTAIFPCMLFGKTKQQIDKSGVFSASDSLKNIVFNQMFLFTYFDFCCSRNTSAVLGLQDY